MTRKSIALLLLALIPGVSFAGKNRAPQVTVEQGAKVFYDRCTLCHGYDGLGEGVLSLSIRDYPNTNLLKSKHATDLPSLRKAIAYGGTRGEMSEEMPPWGDELTHRDLESVALFVHKLREDPEAGKALLNKESLTGYATVHKGRGVYLTRCALCHGKFGEGDGRMARIIKNPPPFNLTLSGAPDDYLRKIIARGGEAMGRSPRMPPWGGDLTPLEIDSVILYLKTIRAF